MRSRRYQHTCMRSRRHQHTCMRSNISLPKPEAEEAAVTEAKLRPLMPDILRTEGANKHCHQPAVLGYVDVKEVHIRARHL
ncbi:hypothetical protein MTO96_024604 [Rhipicephalus appendiculatus]